MPFGLWWAAACMLNGCGAPTAAPTDVVAFDPAVPEPVPLVEARRADDFVNSIGVNIHVSYFRTPYGTSWASVVKPKLAALGIRHVRDGGVVVPDDRWMEIVYGRLGELAALGIKSNLIMRPAEGTHNYTTLSAFDRLMTYAAPAVEAFEGLNEHDLSGRPGWAEEVRSFQRALFERVKADPRTRDLPVYGPSIGHLQNAGAVGDLSLYMDYGSLHPYPGGRVPMAAIADHSTGLRAVSGGRPVVVTESGYHNAMLWQGGHPPVSEQAAGRYILRLLLDYFNAGIDRTYLYEFIDQGLDLTDREKHFGLLRADGSEKPAYRGLRNLIALLADPGPPFAPSRFGVVVQGDTATVNTMLLARRDGVYFLALWQDAPSFDLVNRVDAAQVDRTVMVRFHVPVRVGRFAPLQSTAMLAEHRDLRSLSVGVPDSPILLQLTPE